MSVAIPNQTRLLVLIGVAAALGLAAFVLRGVLLGGAETSSVTETPRAATAAPSRPAQVTPARPAVKPKPARPAVKLNPGLPAPLAKALRAAPVVVVSLWAPTSHVKGVAAARRGAADSGAGFVAVNVLNEKLARSFQPLAGAVSDPAVVIVRRPGTVVNRFDGLVDATVVAQAAQNAGAR